uniref:Apple domain-containing protein n=1 Tax=Davidia involucrata TaxID=16924 RepID=A0A5B6YQA8_DAVIN
MARAEWGYNGRGKWCSYKRTTLIICTINIGVALYVLHSLYTSLYIYPYNDSQNAFSYTPDQIRKMEELIQIRKASEPKELVKLVKEIKKKFSSEERMVELPQYLKQKITDEILERLRRLNANANTSEQREAVESWRKEKLEEAKRLTRGKTLNSRIPPEEAGMLARALKSNWAKLSEEIGLWMPVEIVNEEHNDKPEGAEEFEEEILPGKRLPPECHTKLHTDYDGAAVRWGLTHHKESAYECCQACFDHARRAKPGEKKCNIWVYCPSETGCYSPDIYEHKLGECWLKYAEKPRLNFKDKYSESYRNSHPNAPLIVPWVSGVVSA